MVFNMIQTMPIFGSKTSTSMPVVEYQKMYHVTSKTEIRTFSRMVHHSSDETHRTFTSVLQALDLCVIMGVLFLQKRIFVTPPV